MGARRLARTALAALLVLSAALAGPAFAAADRSPTDGPAAEPPPSRPTVVAAYPNPVAGGDAGEFALVAVPPGTNGSRYVLTDGDWRVPVGTPPNGTRIAVANDERARERTDHPVVVRSALSLANAGERLRVRPRRAREGPDRGAKPTRSAMPDRSASPARDYRDAPEGEVVRWNGSVATWRPLGATDRPVVSAGPGAVRAFVLPDAPEPALAPIRRAEDRVLLAGYTLTSERVADALVAAHRRNVTVRVLLEGRPVGERTRRGARRLDRLTDAGVTVRVLGGPRERYAYHHAKYAVADDRAVVLTENWKPAGTGGNDSRGWGVVTRQSRIVTGLAATFRADFSAPDARDWRSVRRGRRHERGERATGRYPATVAPERLPVNGTDLLVAPDNAGDEVVRTLEGADASVDVVQVTLGGWDDRLPRALRRAADRGVRVRLLLSDAWYVREDNAALVERFRAWADRTGADLSVRTADPDGRFGKVHAKGVVVDDEVVVLGSLNWNDRAAAANREVLLRLRGRSVAAYYGGVFDGDWSAGGTLPGPNGLPVGLLVAGLGVALLTGLVVRRIEFAAGGTTGVAPPGDAGPSARSGEGGRGVESVRTERRGDDSVTPDRRGGEPVTPDRRGGEIGTADRRREDGTATQPAGCRNADTAGAGGVRQDEDALRPYRRRADDRSDREDGR